MFLNTPAIASSSTFTESTITDLIPEVEPKYIVSHNAASDNGSEEGGNVGLASAKLSLTMDDELDAIGTQEMEPLEGIYGTLLQAKSRRLPYRKLQLLPSAEHTL
jgi:hypothetical protein